MSDLSPWVLILLITLPAIIVLVIAYLIIKQFFQNKEQMELLKIQKQVTDQILPLKLQAYERLLLFFERIHVPNLIARIKTKQMSSGDLQSSLMIAIQQEYEHNVTQQLYTSEKLWQIIQLAKQEIFNQLQNVMIATSFNEDVEIYTNALIEHFTKSEFDPGKKAIRAIKQEAKLLL